MSLRQSDENHNLRERKAKASPHSCTSAFLAQRRERSTSLVSLRHAGTM